MTASSAPSTPPRRPSAKQKARQEILDHLNGVDARLAGHGKQIKATRKDVVVLKSNVKALDQRLAEDHDTIVTQLQPLVPRLQRLEELVERGLPTQVAATATGIDLTELTNIFGLTADDNVSEGEFLTMVFALIGGRLDNLDQRLTNTQELTAEHHVLLHGIGDDDPGLVNTVTRHSQFIERFNAGIPGWTLLVSAVVGLIVWLLVHDANPAASATCNVHNTHGSQLGNCTASAHFPAYGLMWGLIAMLVTFVVLAALTTRQRTERQEEEHEEQVQQHNGVPRPHWTDTVLNTRRAQAYREQQAAQREPANA